MRNVSFNYDRYAVEKENSTLPRTSAVPALQLAEATKSSPGGVHCSLSTSGLYKDPAAGEAELIWFSADAPCAGVQGQYSTQPGVLELQQHRARPTTASCWGKHGLEGTGCTLVLMREQHSLPGDEVAQRTARSVRQQ